MRKRVWSLAACLCFGVCMAMLCPKEQSMVRAKERGTGQAGEQVQVCETASRGSLVYQDGGEKAGIYGADFSLLAEKLSTISEKVFDPICYTHTHQWEYLNVDSRTHTKHCEICGSEFDLIDAHKDESEEACRISNGGRELAGRRYRCACGYQWEKEAAHVLTFDMVDETCHRSRCLLDGTEYCQGYDPVEEEHYAYYRELDQTGTHYIKTCIDCGYQVTEEIEPGEPPEQTEEETETTETEETSEITEEETETSEMEETPEITEKETVTSEPGEIPVVSVSGNDCPVEKEENEMEEIAEEITDKGGEQN